MEITNEKLERVLRDIDLYGNKLPLDDYNKKFLKSVVAELIELRKIVSDSK